MNQERSALDPEVLAHLQGLKVQVPRVVEGVLAGLHRSPRNGVSIEFVEHKEYSPGDDPRHLDWRVLGRLDRHVTKKYEDETNMQVTLAVDFSGSMAYGSGPFTKAQYGSILAASLATLLLRQGDRVGLEVLSGSEPTRLPPQSRTGLLADLVGLLERAQPQGPTELGQIAGHFIERTKRRGMLVLISDLFDPEADLLPGLKMLAARGHHVVVFHVLDRDEIEFPFEEPTLFTSMEDERRLLSFPREVRRAYLDEMDAFRRLHRRQLSGPGMAYELARTDEPPHEPLLRHLSARAVGAGRPSAARERR